VFAAPAAGAIRSTATDGTLLRRPEAHCRAGDDGRSDAPTDVGLQEQKLACELNASGHDVSPNTVGGSPWAGIRSMRDSGGGNEAAKRQCRTNTSRCWRQGIAAAGAVGTARGLIFPD
jgi:hypothetical protein